ncbi:MAG TPA: SDR family oxidoreductase [Saliniramus sp.]|nr:SDR family oxidoreductase [Saliniramus sp.]
MNLFCFGLGFSAAHLVDAYRDRFTRIIGTTRSPEKRDRLEAQGIEARLFGGGHDDERIAGDLAECDALLISASPEDGIDPVLPAYGDVIAASPRLSWIGYLSTIGVYGDQGGRWIDESEPANPGSKRSRERVAAEEEWLALGRRTGKPVQIFRLAGIYGPGRNAVRQLKAGTARRIIKPGQVFNRIHVEDIARTLLASMEKPRNGAIYNVCDNDPAPPQYVITFAAERLGIAPPPEVPFEEAELSPMGRSFYAECKRVSNRLIREELGVTMAYPTYREAMRDLAQSE